MASLAIDDNLRCRLAFLGVVVSGIDALLQLEDHRTGGVDNLDAVATGDFIGLGWLAVGTQQHLHVVQLFQLLMGDGLQALTGQTVHLGRVVHDVT